MIKVLNHGYVSLVNHMGSDNNVVSAARVSYSREGRSGEDIDKDARLIRYLINNKHTSPFEHVVFSFEVKCPIFVARQWMRHRTWSYNEVSARYTELPDEFYVPELDQITTQSSSNKQMRTNEPNQYAELIKNIIENNNEWSYLSYKSLLKRGCPRELARSVFPVGTYTKFVGTVDLHNLLHFLELRLHEHAQYEIRVYAEAILELITPIVPVTIEAWRKKND